ncbi:hypothetical protein CARUB_v10014982mg [Capsella rubella]|uniref:Uncharacterized protein n=1 Tax=Capsella rubella TaxID=81985 RepID=R0G802_9BRAS|nr:uncharacterized protein LOC17891788 [Capsella rubella]EOA31762.1 hypothetical protein CARUB_v10014982mg [Capsella rubella]
MGIDRSLVLILLLISVSLSTARILPGEFLPVVDGVMFSGEIPTAAQPAAVVGCGGEQETKTEYSTFVPEVVAGKFGSLVLNALPKGYRPGSGPSRKTNDVLT